MYLAHFFFYHQKVTAQNCEPIYYIHEWFFMRFKLATSSQPITIHGMFSFQAIVSCLVSEVHREQITGILFVTFVSFSFTFQFHRLDSIWQSFRYISLQSRSGRMVLRSSPHVACVRGCWTNNTTVSADYTEFVCAPSPMMFPSPSPLTAWTID